MPIRLYEASGLTRNDVMCLAIPSKIVQINDLKAVVDVYGARRDINLMLMPEEVGLGDYVLVHAGFAIQKVEQDAAREALKVIATIIEEVEREDGVGQSATGLSYPGKSAPGNLPSQ
jgi:hydrogenase expression/formation protein HypC